MPFQQMNSSPIMKMIIKSSQGCKIPSSFLRPMTAPAFSQSAMITSHQHYQKQNSPRVTLRHSSITQSTVSTFISIPRFYSTTSFNSMSIGRRRRSQMVGGQGGIPASSMELYKPNNLIEPELFAPYVTALFETVHKAMIPLIPINDVMILSRGESALAMREEEDRLETELKEIAKKEKEESNKADPNIDRTFVFGNNYKNEDREPKLVPQHPDGNRIIDGPYLKIELGPTHGQYTFIGDLEYNNILFQSPTSGLFVYYYDLNKSNEWIEVNDKHNLLGMFVRDIIRQIHGVPKI